MQSMTGYGKAEYNKEGVDLVVEIRSVNNRFLDVVSKYPRSFMKYDDLIRKTVSQKLSRGRVEVMIQLNKTELSSSPVNVDLSLAASYYNAAKRISEAFPDLKNDLTVGSIMRSPDVVTQEADGDEDRYGEPLKAALINALDNLNAMRKTEGDKLKADLIARNKEVLSLVKEIEARAPLVKEDYFIRLKERMKELLGGVDYDQTRLLQEVAVFADKSNIDEEITRLKSHVSQLYEIAEQENSGKKLDFLMQEFNREANTICSKSNDVTITSAALKLKCEIEKMREQIQNVE